MMTRQEIQIFKQRCLQKLTCKTFSYIFKNLGIKFKVILNDAYSSLNSENLKNS